MKKKNGFFAISIIFSFFIVFLMLITMNLTRYAQNRILLAQVKKDIKNTSKLKVENHTLICKRADITTLHTSYCGAEAGYGCNKIPGMNDTQMMTYGNQTTTSGTLNPGDAFDCDVDKDGVYDSELERFYFVSYLENDSNTAVFIYSNNTKATSSTIINNNAGIPFSSNNTRKPDNAVTYLPFNDVWKNVSVKLPRNIMNDNLETSVSGYSGYNGHSARLLTYRELSNACSRLYDCGWLFENTKFDDSSLSDGYWMEYVSATYYNAYYMSGTAVDIIPTSVTDSSIGVRPVIEVPKDRVEVNFK